MGLAVSSENLKDRYFIQKVKLGRGSFGTVWRAVDRRTDAVVAVKQLEKARLPVRGVSRKDIEREIAMMKAVPHENIIQLYDHWEDRESIYLALEYCGGGDFGDKILERGKAINDAEVAFWMRQICAAIAALHSRTVCHRDIKPDNFMVHDGNALKLCDFGLALIVPRNQLIQQKCGTPAFMAPEQHWLPKRSRGYCYPVDMWAAGVSMYMVMLGGRHPFLTAHGDLDDKLLLKGTLDFRDKITLFGISFGTPLAGAMGGSGSRWSEDSRRLCQGMVEPDPRLRISAVAAMRDSQLAKILEAIVAIASTAVP